MSTKHIAAVLGSPNSLAQDPARFRIVDVLQAIGGAMSRFQVDPRSMVQSQKGNQALFESHLVSLGGDLIAYKFGKRQASGAAAADLLADMLMKGNRSMKRKHLHRVAVLVIGEWTNEACQTCRGTGWIFDFNGVMKDCGACSVGEAASGKRRYTDSERSEALGMGVGGYERAISEAARLLSIAHFMAVGATKKAYAL